MASNSATFSGVQVDQVHVQASYPKRGSVGYVCLNLTISLGDCRHAYGTWFRYMYMIR